MYYTKTAVNYSEVVKAGRAIDQILHSNSIPVELRPALIEALRVLMVIEKEIDERGDW